ncbi:MAG: hypothetical protein JOZ96_12325 [Acidobacteria bacterium]|nr:hypothetical protein [Acidobacteriota bacterium]MBV9925795.1 hypothetical protein [Acidobacteriota bacterium]
MRKPLLTLLALALALSAGALGVGAQAPGNNVLGDVVAVDASTKQVFVKTDAGSVVIVSVSDATRILKNPPGETRTDKAVPYTLAEIAAGDRVLALGKLSDDGKTLAGPRILIVNTKAELTAKQEKERAEWQARGVVGVVSAVNAETKEITINTRTPEGPKPVVINAGGTGVKLRRYAPDSIKFADAKPSTFEEVKAGDQLRAKGEKSADGAKFTPDEVVTGSFRTTLGTVKAVDAAKNEITIEQQDKKPLTVVVRPDSVLKQFPADMAAMMGGGAGGPGAAGGAAPAGGGQRIVIQGGPGGGAPAAGGAGAPGQGGAGGPVRRMFDPQQMLERLPPVTLAELKPGQMIVVSSTVGADPTRVTAIQLVANVEPIIAMMQRRQGAGAAGGMGGAAAAGGGMNFGFGIGTP